MADAGLDGKVALITGATRNHGRASAVALAQEGTNLLLCTRQSMERLDETAQLASHFGVRVVTARCDVTDEAQVTSFVQMGLVEFGCIDVVVNSAGWRARGALLDITNEAWEAAVAVNVHAPFLVCKAVIPAMVQHLWGRIINYSGSTALRGASGTGTLKMTCEGLTRAIAREYGKYNVTANCIRPGRIDVERTPGQEPRPVSDGNVSRIPVPREGTLEECAALVIFLASGTAGYITGQSHDINGGSYFA